MFLDIFFCFIRLLFRISGIFICLLGYAPTRSVYGAAVLLQKRNRRFSIGGVLGYLTYCLSMGILKVRVLF